MTGQTAGFAACAVICRSMHERVDRAVAIRAKTR
jgi:hypothetical protein